MIATAYLDRKLGTVEHLVADTRGCGCELRGPNHSDLSLPLPDFNVMRMAQAYRLCTSFIIGTASKFRDVHYPISCVEKVQAVIVHKAPVFGAGSIR